uniref:Uncharacterized protein n=1 Tax=Ralstonia solanacearum TaxID=305 RepID=A0A0S4U7H3_RALSL|nr:protein of unknown function [Ralstonia solanacearum]CUV30732.1 protein of unknown function [Ralstonia solanacearum]
MQSPGDHACTPSVPWPWTTPRNDPAIGQHKKNNPGRHIPFGIHRVDWRLDACGDASSRHCIVWRIVIMPV